MISGPLHLYNVIEVAERKTISTVFSHGSIALPGENKTEYIKKLGECMREATNRESIPYTQFTNMVSLSAFCHNLDLANGSGSILFDEMDNLNNMTTVSGSVEKANLQALYPEWREKSKNISDGGDVMRTTRNETIVFKSCATFTGMIQPTPAFTLFYNLNAINDGFGGKFTLLWETPRAHIEPAARKIMINKYETLLTIKQVIQLILKMGKNGALEDPGFKKRIIRLSPEAQRLNDACVLHRSQKQTLLLDYKANHGIDCFEMIGTLISKSLISIPKLALMHDLFQRGKIL